MANVFDVDQWLGSLKTKYPDIEIPEAEIKGGFLRQDKFSRSMQDLDREKRELDARGQNYQQYETFLTQMESFMGPREAWSTEQLARINQQFAGAGGGNNNQYQPPIDVNVLQRQFQATLEEALGRQRSEFMEEIANTRRSSAMVASFVPKAMRSWEKNFGEDFPEDKFYSFMQPPDPDKGIEAGPGFGLPPDTALQLFMQPKLKEKDEKSWEERLKAAKEEGAREALSRVNSLEPDAAQGYIGVSFGQPSFLGANTVNPDPNAQEPTDAMKVAEFSKRMTTARAGLEQIGMKQ